MPRWRFCSFKCRRAGRTRAPGASDHSRLHRLHRSELGARAARVLGCAALGVSLTHSLTLPTSDCPHPSLSLEETPAPSRFAPCPRGPPSSQACLSSLSVCDGSSRRGPGQEQARSAWSLEGTAGVGNPRTPCSGGSGRPPSSAPAGSEAALLRARAAGRAWRSVLSRRQPQSASGSRLSLGGRCPTGSPGAVAPQRGPWKRFQVRGLSRAGRGTGRSWAHPAVLCLKVGAAPAGLGPRGAARGAPPLAVCRL